MEYLEMDLEKLSDYQVSNYKLMRLEDVANIIRGERVTKGDLTESGYPVVSGGTGFMGYYPKFNRDENTITIAQYGSAGYVNFQTQKFWANDVCYCVYPSSDLIVLNKYLYYCLLANQTEIYKMVVHAAPDYLPLCKLKSLLIPVPPMDIQNKIVHFLDVFTALRTEEKKRTI